ncbi:hypothetical protein BDV95DRAFT_589222 [Massariosphaeria phaeospora]|uniref:Uncharacterized protein n=1 Tax=Massariosphaeria phaeospora TaxID=100035 RepID=A0A7C8MPC2_9PLEO|nr:hypothetical protein BDV95DRAFT_589222 [Massariosphaeria phaeospora]
MRVMLSSPHRFDATAGMYGGGQQRAGDHSFRRGHPIRGDGEARPDQSIFFRQSSSDVHANGHQRAPSQFFPQPGSNMHAGGQQPAQSRFSSQPSSQTGANMHSGGQQMVQSRFSPYASSNMHAGRHQTAQPQLYSRVGAGSDWYHRNPEGYTDLSSGEILARQRALLPPFHPQTHRPMAVARPDHLHLPQPFLPGNLGQRQALQPPLFPPIHAHNRSGQLVEEPFDGRRAMGRDHWSNRAPARINPGPGFYDGRGNWRPPQNIQLVTPNTLRPPPLAGSLSAIAREVRVAAKKPAPQVTQPAPSRTKVLKRSPSIELMKFDDMDLYLEACEKYKEGLKAGWSKDQLLQMIAEIRARPTEEELKKFLEAEG